MYEKESIPKKEFGILIEYLKELKGVARTVRRTTRWEQT